MRFELKSNTMRAAADTLPLAANLQPRDRVQSRNDALTIASDYSKHLEWKSRLLILLRGTPTAN